ncbi:hypothetical protein GCM10022380_19320 [Amycolatopsis tucumanensis]|uniref:HTH cro/C1-type domain-containing protein n=2 Tax=Amycolatopsis tucumanensis TaxID=401106 RepID=A0ABP7HYN5_9PSEU
MIFRRLWEIWVIYAIVSPMRRDPTEAVRRAVGNLIRELRKERGWNQTQLGAAVGVDQSTVSEWERGAAVPRELRAIADALGVPFDRFRQVIEAAAAAADAVEEAIRSQSLLSKESMEALVVMYRKVLAADTADLGRN